MHAFYNLRRRNLLAARPNAAHFALARLEAGLAERGGSLFLCTQNIDDLHEQAGSRAAHHMHGQLLVARCGRCGRREECRGDLSVAIVCEGCGQSGAMRPDVVWFGELPFGLDRIEAALARADLFVAVGTSGAVYPAAGYVAQARASGIPHRGTEPRAVRHRGRLRAQCLRPRERDGAGLRGGAPWTVTPCGRLRPAGLCGASATCYDRPAGDGCEHGRRRAA